MSKYEQEQITLFDFSSSLQNCLFNGLNLVQVLLDPEIVNQINLKIQQMNSDQSIIQAIQYFITVLINKIQHLRQALHGNADKEDYQNLQNAVQKTQAEIRKHIRLQQQLKIYMDSLQEKVEELQKQVEMQSTKYLKLFDNTKLMDIENRQLKKKIKSYQIKIKSNQQKQIKILSHKTSKILSQPLINQSQQKVYKIYNQKIKATRSRNFIARSSDHKILHISHGSQYKNDQIHKKGLQGDIDISLSHSRKNYPQKNQFKQMTRTIQFKDSAKKQSRKLLKYSTQQKSLVINNKKDIRSNSVCH